MNIMCYQIYYNVVIQLVIHGISDKIMHIMQVNLPVRVNSRNTNDCKKGPKWHIM